MAEENRRIISPEEAAKYLRLPLTTLTEYREQGRGPRYYQLEDVIRYSVADLNRWLNINSAETVWLMSDGGEQ